MYPGYIALQFEIRNLLPDVLIKDVLIQLQLKDTPLQHVNEIQSGAISQNSFGYCYSILTYDGESVVYPIATLKAKMVFTAIEIDPTSKAEQGSYPDEYSLPDVTISAKDYIQGKPSKASEFQYFLNKTKK